VTEVTDSTGTLLARFAYDPWGRRTVTGGTDVTNIAYTGHQWHSPSGLSLTQYRGYLAELGRWTQPDPSGLVDGPNLYEYVASNPVRYTDPLGLFKYNAGPPQTVPVPFEGMVSCIEGCTGMELVITGGAEQSNI
jgi:RHS repeat-associated protein